MSDAVTKLTIGTRKSRLARWQTDHVAGLLRRRWGDAVEIEIRPFSTRGDDTQKADLPLPEIGGKGLFTAELENALHTGEIDLAVHSLKDLPVEDVDGLTLGAIGRRANVQDTLVSQHGRALADLPAGAVVGTGSPRRAAQLLAHRPDLEIRSIRGNVETRIRKVVDDKRYDATLLAAAGLERLQIQDAAAQYLPVEMMLPAPGQAALAVQCRSDDAETLRLLTAVEHRHTRLATTAERQFLFGMGGGCSAPIAALATVQTDENMIVLHALVASLDGQTIVRVQGEGEDPQELGRRLAAEAKAQGADALMEQE